MISLAFGALLTFTSSNLSFEAQERFGGVMSIIAVGFVTWMIFWMRRTARFLKTELQGKLDTALTMGALALVVTAFLAVAREGLETSLFLWAAAQASGSGATPLIGASLGIVTAVILGWLLYRRAVSINLAKFFTWTGAGLILVAGGVLAYGVHDLQEAGDLPGLNNLAFDVSDAVPPDSWYGTLLKGIFNFSPATTWLEAAAWLLYVVPVMFLFFRPARATAPKPAAPAPTRNAGQLIQPTFARTTNRRSRMPSPRPALALPALLCLLAAPVLAACGDSDPDAGGATVAVEASDDACKVSDTELEAGPVTFEVTNKGSKVTEVYVYGEQGGEFSKIISEVENIGPGTSRDLSVDLGGGTYEIACKPGQTGDGIRTKITVSGDAAGRDGRAGLRPRDRDDRCRRGPDRPRRSRRQG